ncbi:MAG: TonB family protein [Cyclobacteriaceae bacterium]|nr:TonB family protein [Cyclobacteriaceae bacterium]
MEPKKTEKANLDNKRGLYFNVGLVVTMAIIVLAFDWRSYDRNDIVLQGQVTEMVEDLLDIPPTEQPPPPPPKIQQPEIIEVPDEEEIEEEIEVDLDIEITEEEVIEEIVFEEVEEEVADEIFTIVEDPAGPEGGMKAFYEYVGKKIKYPSQARRMGIEGRVFVEFVVDKDGSITNVKSIKGIGAGCDEEAVRIIKMHPKWRPGKQRGKPVKQKIVLPINFQLG